MFGFSFGELIVISLVALVAVGPQKLPGMLKTMGQWARKLRKMTMDVRQQTGIDEMLRAEGIQLSELRSLMRGYHGGPFAAAAAATAPAPAATPTAPAPNPFRYEDPYGNVDPDPTREYPLEGADAYGALPDDLMEPSPGEVAIAPGPAPAAPEPTSAPAAAPEPVAVVATAAAPAPTAAPVAAPTPAPASSPVAATAPAPASAPVAAPAPVAAAAPPAPVRSVPPPPPSRAGAPRPSGNPPPPPRRSAAPRPEPSSPLNAPEAGASAAADTNSPGGVNGNG